MASSTTTRHRLAFLLARSCCYCYCCALLILPIAQARPERRQYPQPRQYPEDFLSGIIPLTNDNIRTAVALWVDTVADNRTRVEEAYGGPIEAWDVTGVTDLSEVFADIKSGDLTLTNDDDDDDDVAVDLNRWDVSRVTSMRALFYNTTNFAAKIDAWDTRKVYDMRVMLAYATDFRSDISTWKTDSLELLRAAFTEYSSTTTTTPTRTTTTATTRSSSSSSSSRSVERETLPISHWKTPELTDMEGLFAGTKYFSTDLSGWSTSKVTNMAFMLENSVQFYGGDLSLLDTSNVITMESMFAGATDVRGARDIGSWWNTAMVNIMDRIFYNTTVTFGDDTTELTTTTPDDTDLFYLCWDLDGLNTTGALDEAFCFSNAGGFNCACVPDDIVHRINSGCNMTRKTCFNALKDTGDETAKDDDYYYDDGNDDPDVVSGESILHISSGGASVYGYHHHHHHHHQQWTYFQVILLLASSVVAASTRLLW